jgi:predicted RNase H-like nuclease (RuvC/YqgF family)
MRLSRWFRLAAVASMFALTALSFPTFGQDQNSSSDDVAAAARKARAQKDSAPKPSKVVTNDDIPAAKTETPAAEATGAKPGETATANGGKPASKDDADNDPKSEAYWTKRFQKIQDQISGDEKELDVLQRELNKGQVQYYSDPQKALTEQHDRSDINEKTAKIDAKKKEIEDLKQQLTELEDEMRKAGGDPGWAR